MTRTRLMSLFCLLILAIASAPTGVAANPGVEQFVRVEADLRAATNEGMRRRLVLLDSPEYSAEADERLDAETRGRVAAVYAAHGTTAAAHSAFGTRYAAEIEAWVMQHPEWRSRQQALQSEFESLSSQFSAAR